MSRIFHCFTAKLSIIIVILAFITAITLYEKEAASIVRLYANGGLLGYSLTKEETANLYKASFFDFIIFCMPLIPLFICIGRKYAQMTVIFLSLVSLMLVLSASPGGDRKGCEDCFGAFLFSGISTVLFSICSVLWIAVLMIFRFFTCNSRNNQEP